MLGNHGDAFFLTPIPTRVTSQAARASQKEMPHPRPMGQSATVTRANPDFLPGLGNHRDFLPGLGNFGLSNPSTLAIVGVVVLGACLLLKK